VTGGTRELTDEVRASKGLSPDIEPVPLISPLGQAIFDKKSGDKTAVLINGRSLPVEIIAIQ
jgi:transcription elongation GreA/GreB family factor